MFSEQWLLLFVVGGNCNRFPGGGWRWSVKVDFPDSGCCCLSLVVTVKVFPGGGWRWSVKVVFPDSGCCCLLLLVGGGVLLPISCWWQMLVVGTCFTDEVVSGDISCSGCW